MKTLQRTFIVGLLTVLCLSAKAQKNDYMWLSGYDSDVGYDSVTNTLYGNSVLDFNYSPRHIGYDSLGMNFFETNVSYSDTDGNLLFYSNGIYVANRLDERILNSDSINYGPLISWWNPMIAEYGYTTPQGILALDHPGLYNNYYLVHAYIDTAPAPYIQLVTNILTTTINLDLNAGHGVVLLKNVPVITDTLGWELTAVRHGNGRDWWILAQERNSNCYYRLLLDNNGLHVMSTKACGGCNIEQGSVGSCCFSPDGTKFVEYSVNALTVPTVNIFDFDRCTGLLSNSIQIPLPTIADSGWFANGVAISANSRFLYVGATFHVYQYDLKAQDIAASIDTVAIYDGFQAPFGSYFNTMQIGPDGKIYESCGNGEKVYHVIERPDEKGDSCEFVQHGISLPTFSIGIPNFPNYRLGALFGSSCDTLTGLSEEARTEKEKIIKIYPNPASDYITIDYGYTNWVKGNVDLEILNALGQIVYAQTLPSYSGFQKVDVSNLPQGYYVVQLKRNAAVVAERPFVKE